MIPVHPAKVLVTVLWLRRKHVDTRPTNDESIANQVGDAIRKLRLNGSLIINEKRPRDLLYYTCPIYVIFIDP